MAQPFRSPFDKDSPMTPQSASSISYQANVNRQKTKKWAEAKPVDYGGGWGDDDEYDDYPPPPVSKPTGLRQQGQGLQHAPKAESPVVDNKKYGELPPLPGAPRGRANSFDADDERRDFSSSSNMPRQPSPAAPTPTTHAPATRFSQITGVPTVRNPSGPPALHVNTQQSAPAPTGLRKAVSKETVSPVSGSPHPDPRLAGRVNSGESSVISPASDTRTPSTASDFHARRDFSPSAVPQPLTTRASPAPQSATDSPAARFPARKSSLSQVMGPPLADITGPPPGDATPKPWVGARSASPGPTIRAPATPTGKALPFIRPADIYKRAEEERRQSQDSGRPSLDSLTRPVSTDRSDSPAKVNLREKSSSDSLGHGRRRTSFDDETSDSGRRLMPMLDTVKERKSEYGFDGFNVNDQIAQQAATEHTAKGLDVEDARRQSTSPKLPDLNRISGFGMDLFGPPKSEEAEKPFTRETETTPTAPSTSTMPLASDDLKLRTQPSFGFNSVVHQAFDAHDDNSVPATPASRSDSGVRRSDSESTGTTGISPIMSRVPSSAIADGRIRDTPTILEVVNEPSSPQITEEQRHPTPPQDFPGFKPGHRRDISTPSPGNSPARTPDLQETKINTSGQHAVVSAASPELSSPTNESEPLQAPRPIAEREQSFRPSLPGGWTSYATTAGTENSNQIPAERAPTPSTQASVQDAKGDEDYDLTPTTKKQTLPQSAFGAAVVGAFGRRDNSTPTTPSPEVTRDFPNNNGLPTPDLSMAPAGNLYAAKEVDPRLLPKLEQAPAETQLRPDTVDRQDSEESLEGPTPPEKDVPHLAPTRDTEYSNNDAPSHSQPSYDQMGRSEGLVPPVRPHMQSKLSTDTGPDDEINDKLQKDIVKSLSTRTPDVAANEESSISDQVDDGSFANQSRESTYLPREYDNYWASTAEEQVPEVPSVAAGNTRNDETVTQVKSSMETESQGHLETDTAVIAPLSPRRHTQDSLEPPRPAMQQRFSWEGGSEDVPLGKSKEQDLGLTETDTPVEKVSESNLTSNEQGIVAEDTTESKLSPVTQEPPVQTPHADQSHDDHHSARDATLISGVALGGAALGGAALHSHSYAAPELEPKSRRLSLAEEKDPRVSSHPVSPTPPEEDHPARSPIAYFPTSPAQATHPPAPSTVSPIASPVLAPFNPPATKKVLAFQEIVAISSPQQRIQTFDETRKQFASMNSGLNEWLVSLQTQFPEHATATGSWGGARFPNSASQSKLGKPPGGAAPPLQQPYYQQYLNASSPTTPSTPVGRPSPGPAMPSGSQQGFSSHSNKLTTHQVQAKGKEFLHTAGIFGGKAGKAGKGLLAKGKNKLQAARGGDKTSPPPKPKNDRRSSWGLPLALSRSSGRPEASSRSSKEFSTPTAERSRAPTLTSDRDSPAPQLPNFSTGQPLTNNLPHLANMQTQDPASQQQYFRNEPPTIRQVTEPDVPVQEERDTLNVPAPIGKHQPSWDPFNATPIAEEEAYNYEDRPTQDRQLSNESTQGMQKSDRTNSEDAQFFDASEEPEEHGEIAGDWVMVPSDTAERESLPKDESLAGERIQEESEPIVESEKVLPTVGSLGQNYSESVVEAQSIPPLTGSMTQHTAEPIEDSETALFTTASTVQHMPQPTLEASQPIPSQPQVDTPRELEPERAAQNPSAAPVMSILNRPRGSSYEVPSPPHSAKITPPIESPPVRPVVSPIEVTPSPTQPAQPFPTESEQETQANSSFLPPIRKGSTFKLGFGSRNQKPRFPIEDEEEMPEQSQQPNISLLQGPGIRDMTREEGNAAMPNGGALKNGPDFTHTEVAQSQTHAGQYITPSPPNPPVMHSVPKAEQSSHQKRPSASGFPVGYPQPQGPPSYNDPPLRQSPPKQQGSLSQSPDKAHLAPMGSSGYSQNSMNQQRPMQPGFMPPRAADILQRPEFRESQVEWRPNRPKVVTSPPQVSPTYYNKETAISPPPGNPPPISPDPLNKELEISPYGRNSWEQRPRGFSGSSPSHGQPPIPGIDRSWTGPPAQPKPYEQPPSSAQRYPELFRPGQVSSPSQEPPQDGYDLPPQHYQAPISRSAAFLPRQQTNEYQLPGVGPPVEEPRSSNPRRNSGFFKEIGGRISRASSRERRNSISHEGRDRRNSISREGGAPSPVRPTESRGEYAESSVASEGELEQRRKRSSFFGNLNRASTSGLGPPVSRESIIAHHPGSRTDLLASGQPSPVAQERKKSFFGSSSSEPKAKANKLTRSSTGSLEPSAKKNRFSGFGGLFNKTGQPSRQSVQEHRPQATRELSYNERQPIESPQPDSRAMQQHAPVPDPRVYQQQARAPDPRGFQQPVPPDPRVYQQQSTPSEPYKAPSQSRSVLSKLSASSSPRQESKNRRPSASGLLSGLMGRKSERTGDGRSDDSRSQGSQSQQGRPQFVPPAQSYSDIQEPLPQSQVMAPPPQPQVQLRNAREIPFQDPTLLGQERGRRVSREPQYDSVPIPGGYQLVRGQGAMVAQTQYDPRGLAQYQQPDPRYMQQQTSAGRDQGYGNSNGQHPQHQLHHAGPQLTPHNTSMYDQYNSHIAPRRISREDMLARSPPKSPEGQQRPYQLSLPGGDDIEDEPVPVSKPKDPIQRLQQPTLRHPESPATYPLPDDTVFSPINPSAHDYPPPPPPKWPDQLRAHERQVSLSTMDIDLDRSNTRRTAVSAISGMSIPRTNSNAHENANMNSGGLNVPGNSHSHGIVEERGRGISPSPTPPSPMQGTPERGVSPDLPLASNEGAIKKTEIRIRNSSPDLYNASPRLPKGGRFPGALDGGADERDGMGKENERMGNGNANLSLSPPSSVSTPNSNPPSISHPSTGNPATNMNSIEPAAQANIPPKVLTQREQLLKRAQEENRRAQEEKILFEGGKEKEVVVDENEPPSMSATSYPGQEWNPYGAGAWDEGYD